MRKNLQPIHSLLLQRPPEKKKAPLKRYYVLNRFESFLIKSLKCRLFRSVYIYIINFSAYLGVFPQSFSQCMCLSHGTNFGLLSSSHSCLRTCTINLTTSQVHGTWTITIKQDFDGTAIVHNYYHFPIHTMTFPRKEDQKSLFGQPFPNPNSQTTNIHTNIHQRLNTHTTKYI